MLENGLNKPLEQLKNPFSVVSSTDPEKTKAAYSGFPFGASGDYSLQLVSVQSSYPNR